MARKMNKINKKKNSLEKLLRLEFRRARNVYVRI